MLCISMPFMDRTCSILGRMSTKYLSGVCQQNTKGLLQKTVKGHVSSFGGILGDCHRFLMSSRSEASWRFVYAEIADATARCLLCVCAGLTQLQRVHADQRRADVQFICMCKVDVLAGA